MVTRRTRNYKDKKPMATFGQFILPLTVIMAVALLFFSVKLFFFNSDETGDIIFSGQETVSQESFQPEAKVTEQDFAETEAQKIVEIKQAQPVDAKEEVQQKKTSAETATAKTTVAAKATTVQSIKNQPASLTGARWDVQIGAFSSKENALQLIKEVKSKGYTAYLAEAKKDGTSFYKVRIKNPKTGRDEATALSAKLQKDGYPFFLVEIK